MLVSEFLSVSGPASLPAGMPDNQKPRLTTCLGTCVPVCVAMKAEAPRDESRTKSLPFAQLQAPRGVARAHTRVTW